MLSSMSNFWKIIQIASIIISFFGVFFATYSESLVKPDIKVNVKLEPKGNFTSAIITMDNAGLKPATNVMITLNPLDDIIKYDVTFHTEDIELDPHGSKSLVGKMSRFADGQELILTTLLNSTNVSDYLVFVTHDKGSTNYHYGKPMPFDIALALSLAISLITAVAAAVSTQAALHRYKNITINKNQFADRGSFNFQDVVDSKITIIQGEKVPINSNVTGQDKLSTDSNVRDLISKIGKEKILNLLQQAKIIAHDYKDKEMEEWINHELNGYVPPGNKQLTRDQAKKMGLLPDYRDIKGKLLIGFSDGSTSETDYPVLFGSDIKQVEDSIDRLKKGGVTVSIQHTFGKDVQYVGGTTGNLYLPQAELEGIVRGAERRLSQYLELKMKAL